MITNRKQSFLQQKDREGQYHTMKEIPLEDTAGDIVQKARTGHGLSQEALARTSGVDSSRLIDFENDKGKLSREEVIRLASTLMLHPDRLWEISEGLWHPNPTQILKQVIPLEGFLGGYRVWAYLLIDDDSKSCAIVDTANSPSLIIEALHRHHLTASYLLLTHTHYDHAGGANEIATETGAKILCHPQERFMSEPIRQGETIKMGKIQIHVLETQGHTPGGTSFYVGDFCFVGDALFAGSMGRTPSPAAYQKLLGEIQAKILGLPDSTVLFPGHGPATTVVEERHHNPFFL